MQERNGPRSGSQGLPIAGERRPERADARRNRLKVLAAAEQLFAEHGVRNVSLDAIAAAAGVGKGTVFRRFGDRAGLAVALLDERERELQDRILNGSPPLGPGAPAAARLCAFLEAYVALLDAHVELVLDSENAATGARYRVGAYRFWHRHVAILLEEASPDLDADYTAHALLAPLAADLHQALRAESYDIDRITSGLRHLATALTGRSGG
jgi:AcrR family transcriptional regulator